MVGVLGQRIVAPISPTLCRRSKEQPSSPPPIPSPSDLYRYLNYTAANLGVGGALAYEDILAGENYGPDILPIVQVSDLTELGITKGDTLHLRAGCANWSRGHKRKRDDGFDGRRPAPNVSPHFGGTGSDRSPGGGTGYDWGAPQGRDVTSPMDHLVENLFSYQITFLEGGGAAWSGPPMTMGDRSIDDEKAP
jgi:hypothetical protein